MEKFVLQGKSATLTTHRTSRWKNPFKGQGSGYLYILPSLLFLLAVLGFPILYSVYMSFQKYTLETLVSGKFTFIGLDNYLTVVQNPNFRVAVQNSFTFTTISIVFQFSIGFAVAVLFSQVFPLKGVLRGFLLSGWQIPSVVVGTIFLWMFNLDYGLINYVLNTLGIQSVPWMIQSPAPLLAVIIANIWLGIPFNVILMTAGLAGLPEDVYEAATVDGANSVERFFYITIPMLRPTIFAVLMLGLIYTLRVFDIIWIMTRGGPGNATEVLPTYAYRLSFINFQFGQSSAVAVIMLILLFVVAIFYTRNAVSETME
ncbi:MAG: sugar ABC transporter permease [Chloroflexota bacterium]